MGSTERNWSVVCRADGLTSAHLVAKDSSGNGNDLPLVSPPMHLDVDISKAGYSLTHRLVFNFSHFMQASDKKSL